MAFDDPAYFLLEEGYKDPNEKADLHAQLAEELFFLAGTFSQEYLELPVEVLASCMKKNQKIFACYDTKGQLKNQFVAVMNGKRGVDDCRRQTLHFCRNLNPFPLRHLQAGTLFLRYFVVHHADPESFNNKVTK